MSQTRHLNLSISLPEINTRLLGSILVDPTITIGSLITVEFSDLAPGVEGGYEAGVLVAGPVLDGEHEGVLGELLRRVGEGQVAEQTQPSVVEAESHEGKEEVDLLQDYCDNFANKITRMELS